MSLCPTEDASVIFFSLIIMKQNKTNQINMTKNSLKQNQMTANHNKAKNIKDWQRTQHITHWSVFITFTVYWRSYPLYFVR